RGPNGHGCSAGARRIVGDTRSRDVRDPRVPRERGQAEHRVHDAASSPHHGRTLARDIPGHTHAWREVFADGLPKRIAYARLTRLNHSYARFEVAQGVVGRVEGRSVFPTQAEVEHDSRDD